MLALLLIAAQASAPAYSVAPVQFAIPIGQKMGVKRAGALCLPNGSLSWDGPAGNASAARAVIATALRRAGLAVVDSADPVFGDPEPVTPFRIVARVTGGHLSLCQPNWGALGIIAGNKAKVKGRGRLIVHWELWSRTPRQMTFSRDLAVDADVSGEGGLVGTLDAALAASALAFGKLLQQAPEQSEIQP